MTSRPARRVLFRSSSRRGLGHLVRGLNIAKALRRRAPDVEVGLFTRGDVPEGLAENGLISMIRSSSNGSGWNAALRDFDPAVTIDDTLLPIEQAARNERRKQVFVMRRCRESRQRELLQHELLRSFDRILVPHEEREFGFAIPEDLSERTCFVGPIVREPRRTMHAPLRLRYRLSPDDFVLISTLGGGGFPSHARSFLEAVTLAHRELAAVLPGFRHLVVTGPRFEGSVEPVPGMNVIATEPELPSLLGVADCVVSAGGYNTVNEIRSNRVPAILLPGTRSHDDQSQRVAGLAEAGLAIVAAGSPRRQARAIVETCTAPATLAAMRKAYAKDCLVPGNGPAAVEILKLLSC